jgi:hypothetical protein
MKHPKKGERKKKGEKDTKWKDPSPGKKKKSPTGVDHKGSMKKLKGYIYIYIYIYKIIPS